MKRQAVLLLSTLMAFSLAACGGAPSSKTTAEKTEAAAQETAPASDAEKGDERTKITFINGFTGGDGPFMRKIVDGFNESQDQYFIEQLQDADHYTKFKSDHFDMLIIHADWISTYHALGLLREVSDLYDKAGISFDKDFHPITQSYAKYDDGVFAFPLDLYAETFYYNKELVDTPPKNYDDMIALRDKLDSVNTGIYPIGIPLTGDQQWAWMTALGQSGCNWVEGEHIKMDTEEICDAFMKVHNLIYKDHLSAEGLGDQDHYNTFVNESADNASVKSAVCLTGPWNYTAAKEILGDNLGIGVLPQLYGDTPCVPAGGHTFGVSAEVTDQKKLDGIAAFMKYAYQPDVMLNWADSGQAPIHLATMEKVKDNPEKYPVANVNYGIFDDAMILPAIYNIREQVKYVNSTVWALVLQEPELTGDQLMAELKNATDIAIELSEQ
ncbi:extracellular solute-binding protein [Lacrimispora indolis]|uniref:extracellular solute-binding protein n=1 Tax=Lacrimispora indolis TaxID=69825 RepID=UPI00045E9CB5|nr:extracellular solute-binding protein [Lacrimispora indolis]